MAFQRQSSRIGNSRREFHEDNEKDCKDGSVSFPPEDEPPSVEVLSSPTRLDYLYKRVEPRKAVVIENKFKNVMPIKSKQPKVLF